MRIEEKLLDKLIPVPDKFEKAEEIRQKLEDEGFNILYWENGGIFKTIVMVFLKVYEEVVHLLRYVLYNSYLATASEEWLDVKANDYSRYRKKALKTIGNVTLKRAKAGSVIQIPKGYIFKTEMDSKGREYRFIVQEQQYMQSYETSVDIKVVAEEEGEEYNLPADTIIKCVQYISGVDQITNEKDWIIKEGSSEEDDEDFRERTMDWYDELAQLPTGAKFRAIALAVDGVMQCYVDDLHPRGQGTIDIILIGAAGVPSQTLIDEVKVRIDTVKGPYDDVHYILPKEQEISISVEITIGKFIDETSIKQLAKETIETLLRNKKGKSLNYLYQAQITSELMKLQEIQNVKVISPTSDIEADNKTIIKLTECNVTVKRI